MPRRLYSCSPSIWKWLSACFITLSALTIPGWAYVNGDRVQAVQAVNVRNAPAGSVVTQRLIGDLGTITNGPVTATLGATSYVWYQVDWDTGGDGWSFTGGLGAAPSTPVSLVYGIDVSRWQTSINWPAVYADGKRFAFCKATEGTSMVDPWFTINAVNGRAAGVLVGFYHFARPLDNNPITEARHFVKTAAPYLIQGNLLPVLDLESGESLGRSALSMWAKDWLGEVQRLTQLRPIIYINRNFAANYMTPDLAAWPLWIAAPGFGAGTPVAGIGAWTDWTFQQYSWTGRVNGVGGGAVDTDLNAFRGTVADLVPLQIPAINQAITSVLAAPAITAPGTHTYFAVGTTASQTRVVLVDAVLFPAGSSTGGIRDKAGETFEFLRAGTGSLTRPFALPANLAAGSYDLRVTLLLDWNFDLQVDSSDVPLTNVFLLANAVTVTAPPANYAGWAGFQGLSGTDAREWSDPDGDGSDNLTEYAFNTHPEAGSSRPLTTLSPQSDGTVVFSFERPQARPDLMWTIQQSDGLAAWTALAAAAGDAAFPGPAVMQTGSGPWQIRVTLPTSGPGSRFLRLRVERNPSLN